LPRRPPRPLGPPALSRHGVRAGPRVQEGLHGRVDRRAGRPTHRRARSSGRRGGPVPRAADREGGRVTGEDGLTTSDLAIDRELADIALGYRFLLDVTPVNLIDARYRFFDEGKPPELSYRPLEDDIAVIADRLAKVAAQAVEDATLAHLVRA